jgi:hypothetical protein
VFFVWLVLLFFIVISPFVIIGLCKCENVF